MSSESRDGAGSGGGKGERRSDGVDVFGERSIADGCSRIGVGEVAVAGLPCGGGRGGSIPRVDADGRDVGNILCTAAGQGQRNPAPGMGA